MQLVLLAGELGEKYGQQHEYYNLHTPADAIKLLCFNYPGLKRDLVTAHHNGVGYKVIQGGAAMGYDELHLPFGSRPLLVVPVISGAGSGGTSQILLGVGLVAASILAAPLGAGFLGLGVGFGATAAPLAAAGGGFIAGTGGIIGAGVSTAIGSIGASLILSGTANLISPQPQLPNPGANRIRGEGTNVRGPGPEGITRGGMGQQSYAFTGPANTVGTGATLPVIYGRVITGGHLIAASLEVSNKSNPLKIATQKPTRENITINSDKLTTELKDCGGIQSRRAGKVNSPEVIATNKSVKRAKVYIDKTFGPDHSKKIVSGDTYTDDRLPYKKDAENSSGKKLRKRVDVIFEIGNGLFDFVGKKDTTRIDGFITYEIRLILKRSGEDVNAASARVTIQGLVNKTQKVIYGNRLELPSAKNIDAVRIEVEIIDAEVHDEARFRLQGYGYDLL